MNRQVAGTCRLFFALWPDGPTRRSLHRETRTAVRRCGGRPVPPANFHITLAFLGNVAADLTDELVAAARLVSVSTMELEFDRFGYWPRARVFWMGPARCPQLLTRLSTALWGKMEALGIPREQRAFQPHLTLCRKVRAEPQLALPRPVRWPVRDYVLVESVTAPGGARYTVVERFTPGSSSDP